MDASQPRFLQDFASRSASMAADRASSVAQAVDLVTLNSGKPTQLVCIWKMLFPEMCRETG